MTDTNQIYYSASTNGFYESLYHSDIPTDAIPLSAAEYHEILTAHYSGKEIIVVGGEVTTRAHIPTTEEIAAAALLAIEATFKATIAAGFTTSSGIKFDADITDINALKSAYDLAQLTGSSTIPLITDYNNHNHEHYPAETLIQDIRELGINYQTAFVTKQHAKAAL